jgi:DNA-binding CsgD family transcriptional regulator
MIKVIALASTEKWAHGSDACYEFRNWNTKKRYVLEGLNGLKISFLVPGPRDLSTSPRSESAMQKLTARESEIVGLVAAGASNQEVATTLGIAEQTVKNHLRSAFQKMHVKNRTQMSVCFGAPGQNVRLRRSA